MLLAIDPELVAPLAEAALHSADPVVRQRGADSYLARPTPDRVRLVAPLLDDPHPDVRGAVRDALFQLAKSPELDPMIRSEAEKVLGQESCAGRSRHRSIGRLGA